MKEGVRGTAQEKVIKLYHLHPSPEHRTDDRIAETTLVLQKTSVEEGSLRSVPP